MSTEVKTPSETRKLPRPEKARLDPVLDLEPSIELSKKARRLQREARWPQVQYLLLPLLPPAENPLRLHWMQEQQQQRQLRAVVKASQVGKSDEW
jgi:hypothetical protein